MKKITALMLAALTLSLLFTGCAKRVETTDTRLNYNYNMGDYVKLDDLKVEIDRNSEEYLEFFHDKLRTMMTTTVTTGKVKDGDTVNIDYVGKKDGVPFDGGSANGYDLTIGSKSFIDGFEDGLIGVDIGSTVDLNLTFPKDYGSAELAGQKVVFTVKVNSAKTSFDRVNNETAKLCGYKDAAEVMALGREYADENYAWEVLLNRAVIEEYPKRENRIFYNEQYKYYEILAENNGMTLDSLLAYYEITKEELEKQLNEEVVPVMARSYCLSYYIIDKNGVKITDEDLAKTKAELDKEAGKDVKEMGVSDNYIEAETARNLALKIVAENITIVGNEEESK